MVALRFEAEECENVDILRESLTFCTSGRTANNRLLKAALSEGLGSWHPTELNKSGLPSKQTVNLYEKWGNGGWGVILTGNIMVDHAHLECVGNVIVSRETASAEKDDMLKKFAAVTKTDGGLAIAQISHGGRQTPSFVNSQPFAPSAVILPTSPRGFNFGPPKELTTEQVKTEVIDRFAYAARKLHEAGFDGVQLHGAHGYLLAQFLSPTTNLRADKYGGSADKRAQILVEIYNAIRKEVPSDFVIGIKLNSVEFQEGGLGLDDITMITKIVDETGFDFVEFSGGTYEKWAMDYTKETTRRREGFFIDAVEAIKPSLQRTAVYLTGGFKTTVAMANAILDGSTDGIGLGRPSTAELDVARKILDEEVQSVPFSLVYSEYMVSAGVCTAQLAQAGATSLEDCDGDVNKGILDAADVVEFQHFLGELGPVLRERELMIAKGQPPLISFVYKLKRQRAE